MGYGAKNRKRRRRKKWAENKKLRLKMQKIQAKQNLLDEESSGQYWAESLSDGETVIETNQEEDSLGEISEEEDTSEEVKRVREVVGDASNADIISIIERIKRARENDNSTIGTISRSTFPF